MHVSAPGFISKKCINRGFFIYFKNFSHYFNGDIGDRVIIISAEIFNMSPVLRIVWVSMLCLKVCLVLFLIIEQLEKLIMHCVTIVKDWYPMKMYATCDYMQIKNFLSLRGSIKINQYACRIGCVWLLLWCQLCFKMDMFSLDDDNFRDLFITQSSNSYQDNVKSGQNDMEVDEDLFLGVKETDMSSPCTSLVENKAVTKYSDISDWEESEETIEKIDEEKRFVNSV